jgi:hypothetical protein
VGTTRQQILQWEGKWSVPAGLATFAAVLALVAATLVSSVSGDGQAEVLRSVHAHSGSVTLSSLLQAAGFLILGVPLFFLFRAAQARSPRVRNQLVGLVVVAPLFLAVSGGLTGVTRNDAADKFVAGEAKSTLSAKEANEKCVSERKDSGVEAFAADFESAAETPLANCEKTKIEDDEAENAVTEASLSSLVAGLGVAGGLGFAVALFYSGLWALRTGLLTRFWGTLGMASGVALLLGPAFYITLVWFIYFGLLLVGKLPKGRPPAWAAGEAIPWPTPGEKVAAELQPDDPDVIDVDAVESPQDAANGSGGERRKRKRRGRG